MEQLSQTETVLSHFLIISEFIVSMDYFIFSCCKSTFLRIFMDFLSFLMKRQHTVT